MLFDPLNLLLLAIAIFIFWRLRGVLGTRTGSERPPFDPYTARREKPETGNGTVIQLPPREGGAEAPVLPPPEPAAPVWTGYAAEGSPLALGLEKLVAADKSFAPKPFLAGARAAYEAIIESFASGDKAALKDLLAPDVFANFAAAIDARAAQGLKVEQRFVGINKANLTSADVQGKRALVTVEFESEIISATRARDGSLAEGDEKAIRTVDDIWTFARDVTSADPNWKLTATQSPA